MQNRIKDNPTNPDGALTKEKLSFRVEGMTCASCVANVEKALKKVDGVTVAGVNLATERAEVTLKNGASANAVSDAVRRAGYEADTQTLRFRVEGMTCAHCEASVVEEISEIAGVTGVTADHNSGVVKVEGEGFTRDQIAAAVEEAGYTLV